MAYSKSKGLLAVATSYSGGGYSYEKIDSFIQIDGLTITPAQMQDLDSFVNITGHLKRKVLEHTRTKVEFNTPYIIERDMDRLMAMFAKSERLPKCDVSEHKIRVRYYNPRIRDYQYMFCYVSDIEFPVGGTYKGFILYQPTRIAFIEY